MHHRGSPTTPVSTQYLCAPWFGQRGDKFLRVFKPAFVNGIRRLHDDYASVYQHMHRAWTQVATHLARQFILETQPPVASHESHTTCTTQRSERLRSLVWQHVEQAAIRLAIDESCSTLEAAIAAGIPMPGIAAGTSTGQLAYGPLQNRMESCRIPASPHNCQGQQVEPNHPEVCWPH